KETTKDWNTFIPQKNIGGDVWFEPLPKEIKDLDQALARITLAEEDIVISPKDLFFPQLETMLEFKGGQIGEVIEASPKLLFGIKPCDLKGLLFADEFYQKNFTDIYYQSRMKERLIVTKGCLSPPRPEACFCSSAKTGPFAKEGYDLQLSEAGDCYFVEIGSTKGESFVSKYGKYFAEQDQEADKQINQIKDKAAESIKLKLDFQKALELMAQDNFIPEENYKRIGERCIYCGACLYSCPTCTCFNVFDNVKKGQGERLRNWDACVFDGYTREASGHNPRQEKWIKTARRYEHKLKYDFKTTGRSGCVGCGRCLSSCPVAIGISKFIQEITTEKRIL
ncbi:MAG: 4Fe-4S dicluster domain-containing protein, partial [Elusimicrobia bacterium]|nr:4Fe-4S dicluster domain-containing protein [Elusimicrobiota bacterium]